MSRIGRWIVTIAVAGVLQFALVCPAQENSAAATVSAAASENEVFSGPQPGEALPAFTLRQVLGAEAGHEIDIVTAGNGAPVVLVFVHDINRQSVSLTRTLTGYTKSREEQGLQTAVVFLGDDATALETQIRRMEHALTAGVVTGVSVDGREGPGSYGLNRNVMLTILTAKAGKVTSNYALIQPSLQVDLPKILQSVVDMIGGEVPRLQDLPGMANATRRAAQEEPELNLRPLLLPVIRRDAAADAVEKAALEVEKQAAQNPRIRKEVARIANTIINAGKLQDYGTPKAQEFLKKWATEFATTEESSKAPETPKPASGTQP